MVCYSDLQQTAGILACGHNDVCGTCHLRLRHLHSDNKCPMCKTVNPQVIVAPPGKLWEDYEIWGNELGADFVYRQDVGMFFPVEYYQEEIQPLFGYHCTSCNEYDGTTPDANIYEQQQQGKKKKKVPTPLMALQDHLRNTHKLALCQLCVDFKRDFVSQLPRFTPTQLRTHLSKGDGSDSGFKGHPLCEFCRPKRFYDVTQLHHHLQTEHYKCHVCDKQGLHNQFFRNYASLQHHFDAQHYLCHDPQCLEARFVVFENEIDLRAHQVQVHGSSGSSKIQLEFRIKRAGHDGSGQSPPQQVPSSNDFQYTLDGQAFVPPELNAENTHGAPNQDISHPMHLARTNELRAHAAEIRQRAVEETEAFPSLNASAPTSSLRVGWSSEGLRRSAGVGNAGREEFPSLPSSSRKQQSVATRLKSGGVSGSRQFAAMRSAAAAMPTTSTSASGWTAPKTATTTTTPRHLLQHPLDTMENLKTFHRSAAPIAAAPRHATLRPRIWLAKRHPPLTMHPTFLRHLRH